MNNLLKRKFATAALITASVAAFATLGDGGKKSTSAKSLLSLRSNSLNYRSFSLKSGYNFRGMSVIGTSRQDQYLTLNTVITYEKGNATYILPLKRKLLLDKVKFGPVAPCCR